MTTLNGKTLRGGGLLIGALAIATIASTGSAAELAAQTRANLQTAMHGEAYAYLKYRTYAEAAREHGDEELANLFETAANVEANEHFAREADALGLATFDAGNLADAMGGEHYENTKMYVDFADQAEHAGDKKAAALFRQIAADEGDHYQQFKDAFVNLTARKQPPAADATGRRANHD